MKQRLRKEKIHDYPRILNPGFRAHHSNPSLPFATFPRPPAHNCTSLPNPPLSLFSVKKKIIFLPSKWHFFLSREKEKGKEIRILEKERGEKELKLERPDSILNSRPSVFECVYPTRGFFISISFPRTLFVPLYIHVYPQHMVAILPNYPSLSLVR